MKALDIFPQCPSNARTPRNVHGSHPSACTVCLIDLVEFYPQLQSVGRRYLQHGAIKERTLRACWRRRSNATVSRHSQATAATLSRSQTARPPSDPAASLDRPIESMGQILPPHQSPSLREPLLALPQNRV